jgi:hypothetical protein
MPSTNYDMKKYSLPYWIKQKLQFVSKPEEVICAAVQRHFETPAESELAFEGSPLELINALYQEWKKRGTVHHCLFPTPMPVARELAALAEVQSGDYVFDPGCGFGNLLQAAIERQASAFGCEYQYWIPQLVGPLVDLDIQRGDFLDGYTPTGRFNVVLTNPPFGKGYQNENDRGDLATAFFLRLAELCNPDTRIAAILPKGFAAKGRPKLLAETFARFEVRHRQDLPDTTFKPLTNIRTEMLLLHLVQPVRPARPPGLPPRHLELPAFLKTPSADPTEVFTEL